MKLFRHIGLWVSLAKVDLVFEVFCRSLRIPLTYQPLTTKVKHRHTFRHVINSSTASNNDVEPRAELPNNNENHH